MTITSKKQAETANLTVALTQYPCLLKTSTHDIWAQKLYPDLIILKQTPHKTYPF